MAGNVAVHWELELEMWGRQHNGEDNQREGKKGGLLCVVLPFIFLSLSWSSLMTVKMAQQRPLDSGLAGNVPTMIPLSFLSPPGS